MSGGPVISNCDTPTEKISEFLDTQLKPIMQKSWSYIKDSGDFIRKIKKLTDFPGPILVTADVVGFYPSIPHQAGLKDFKKAVDARENKFISTDDIVKRAEFVLKKIIFSLTIKLNNRSQVPLLERNLHQLMLVCLWIK